MLIGKKYKIEADSLNVILYERGVSRKSKQEYWKLIGYYSSPTNALKALIDLKVSETGLRELKVVVELIEELKRLIDGLGLSLETLQSVTKPSKSSMNGNLPMKRRVRK